MADALLYFRLLVNKKTLVPDPNNLPAFQKLQFTLPDELLESVGFVHENNIKDAPVSNPAGVRESNKQDNWLQGVTLTFKGRFKDASADIDKIKAFAKRLQVEGQFHQFGIFGFKASNTVSTPFNYDPDDTFGFSIKRLSIGRQGNKPKTFDFEVVLTIGGTLPWVL